MRRSLPFLLTQISMVSAITQNDACALRTERVVMALGFSVFVVGMSMLLVCVGYALHLQEHEALENTADQDERVSWSPIPLC